MQSRATYTRQVLHNCSSLASTLSPFSGFQSPAQLQTKPDHSPSVHLLSREQTEAPSSQLYWLCICGLRAVLLPIGKELKRDAHTCTPGADLDSHMMRGSALPSSTELQFFSHLSRSCDPRWKTTHIKHLKIDTTHLGQQHGSEDPPEDLLSSRNWLQTSTCRKSKDRWFRGKLPTELAGWRKERT